MTINIGGKIWPVNNYEGEALGPINLSQAIAYSDNSVFSQLTAIVGPGNVAATAHQLGITSKLNGYFAIGLGAEPATPLEMARAYASFADGGKRIDGSIFGNQPRAIETVDVGDNAARQRARSRTTSSPPTRRRRSTSCCRASSSTAPAARRRCRAGRSPARPGRPRTTATPGSSATRRRSSSPSGSATPTSSCR